MEESRRTLKTHIINGLYMIGMSLGSKMLHLLYMIWVIRLLAPEEYGKFAYTIATISFFSFFINSGLSSYVQREISADKANTSRLLGDMFILKSILSLFILLVLYFSLGFFTKDPYMRLGFLLMFGNAILVGILGNYSTIFHAHEKFKILSIQGPLSEISLIITGVIILSISPSFLSLLISQMIGSFVVFMYIFTLARRYGFIANFSFDTKRLYNLIIKAIPFTAIDFFTLVCYKSDMVLLGKLRSLNETGLYGVAYGFINRLEFLPATVTNLILPRMATKKDEGSMIRTYELAVVTNMIIAIPIAVIGIISAPELFSFLFKNRYNEAAILLQLLLLAFTFIFINGPAGSLLVNFRYEKKLARAMFFAAMTNVIMNLVFLPRYGAIAAALTTIMAEIIVFFQYSYLLKGHKTLKILLKHIRLPFLAVLPILLLFFPHSDLHILIKMLLATIGYICTFVGLSLLFYREKTMLVYNSIFGRSQT